MNGQEWTSEVALQCVDSEDGNALVSRRDLCGQEWTMMDIIGLAGILRTKVASSSIPSYIELEGSEKGRGWGLKKKERRCRPCGLKWTYRWLADDVS